MDTLLDAAKLLDDLADEVSEMCPEMTEMMLGPSMKPVRWDDDQVPVFDSNQIELYGLPEYFGVYKYRVIALRETESPMVMDWKMSIERPMRPIHRYSRVERFTNTLAQLIACRGKVPKDLITEIKKVGFTDNPDLIWNQIRAILKERKGRKYYNRIPTILEILGFQKVGVDKNTLVREIIDDFRIISGRFNERKEKLGRVYFPSLRFIAFRLLEMHGVKFGYKVPFARTPRKLKAMEATWTLLITQQEGTC